MFKSFFTESIKKLSDDKIDEYIKQNWKKKVITFAYNFEASTELGKKMEVLVSQDKKFMHVEDNSSIEDIKKKFKLKEV